jgi:hypothetical protein
VFGVVVRGRRKRRPDTEILCASEPLEFDDYVKSIGDEKLLLAMLVGDLQRVIEYPKLRFAIEQEVPEDVHAAYGFLIRDGFINRHITPTPAPPAGFARSISRPVRHEFAPEK